MTDFIIVGGGSAGCVLANRLSANPGISVTLIEAGGKGEGLLHRMPAGYFPLMKAGTANWNYETVAQPGLGGRTMYFPLGKALGGSGAINAMVWVRGNAGDFDDWEAQGNPGWGYANCVPYFQRAEQVFGCDPDIRGSDGPVKITKAPELDRMSPISRAWIEAAIAAGYPYNADENGKSQEGFGPAESNSSDGVRQSAAHAYLRPVMDRPNLEVITNALGSRILFDGQRAVGVEFKIKNEVKRIQADMGVILSAGGVHSPHILQLSGVGPASHLNAHGIDVVHDLPGVGQNFHDHLSISLLQEITQPYSALRMLRPWPTLKAMVQYLFTRRGPMAASGLEAMAFVKSDPAFDYPDLQYHLPLLMYDDHGRNIFRREGFLAHGTYCVPKSRGTISLRSADPEDAPLVDPNYLACEEDVVGLRNCLRIARDIVSQSPFDGMRGSEFAPGEAVQSDAELDKYIREKALSVYHPAGSCRMGQDGLAVVAPDLRVHGLEGLHVADASIMPRLVSGNTNATTIMIAEKASDLILQAI